mgnify:CR=1 FL=1
MHVNRLAGIGLSAFGRRLAPLALAAIALTLATGFDRRIVRPPVQPESATEAVPVFGRLVVAVEDAGLSQAEGWRIGRAEATHGQVQWDNGWVRYEPPAQPVTDRLSWSVLHPSGRISVNSRTIEVLPVGSLVFDVLVPASWSLATDVVVRQDGQVIQTVTMDGGRARVVLPPALISGGVIELVGHVQGPDGGVHRAKALVGTPVQLRLSAWRREAGGELTPRVGLNAVSTALHARLVAMDPRVRQDDGTALDRALGGFSGATLLEDAALFELALQGVIAVPAPFSDAYALVQDVPVARGLAGDLAPGVYEAAQAALLADPAQARGFRRHVRGHRLFSDGVNAFGVRSGVLDGFDVMDLRFDDDGRGVVLTGVPTASGGMGWTTDAGGVLMALDVPLPTATGEQVLDCPDSGEQAVPWHEQVEQLRLDGVHAMVGHHLTRLQARVARGWVDPDAVPADCELPELDPPAWATVGGAMVDRRWSQHMRVATDFDLVLFNVHGGADTVPGQGDTVGLMDLVGSTLDAAGYAPDITVLELGQGTGHVTLALDGSGEVFDLRGELVRPSAGDSWSVLVRRTGADGRVRLHASPLLADLPPVSVDFDGLWAADHNTLRFAGTGLPVPPAQHRHVLVDSAGAVVERYAGLGSDDFAVVESFAATVSDTHVEGLNLRTGAGEVVLECPDGETCSPNASLRWDLLTRAPDAAGDGRELVVVAIRERRYSADTPGEVELERSTIEYHLREPQSPVAPAVPSAGEVDGAGAGDPVPALRSAPLPAPAPMRSGRPGAQTR